MDPINPPKPPHLPPSSLKSSVSNTDAKTSEVAEGNIGRNSEPTLTPSAQRPQKLHIGLKIGFFCDVDCLDFNQAVSHKVVLSLNQRLPFITSRSLLLGANIQEHQLWSNYKAVLEKALLETNEEWEIFEQINPDGGEGFLVFIPKSLEPDKSGREKLKALDFADDGSLKPISLQSLFQETPKSSCSIERFRKLFGTEPKLDKLFCIAGHGDSSHVGGLSSNHYKQFTDFLEKQKCKGLAIVSCYSGGASALLSIAAEGKKHPFLILAQSIGDFPTYSMQKAEQNLALFYEELTHFLEKSPQTIGSLRKTIERAEGLFNAKLPVNLIQVYFPHSANVPGGFRPVTEHGTAASLTYAKVKKQEIERSRSGFSPKLAIHNKEFIEIQPLTVSIEIECTGRTPVLLSQVPGNNHHFISAVSSDEPSADAFIQKTTTFHKENMIGANKAFFIGKLDTQENSYEKVVIRITRSSTQYAYQKDGDYFLFNGSVTKKISPFQYALFFQATKELTIPNEFAVRASSGGQDCEDLFSKAVDEIWDCEKIDVNSLPTGLSDEEKRDLLFYFLLLKKENLAMEFFQKEEMDPNIKSAFGIPLFVILLELESTCFLNFLLTKEVDLNLKDLNGDTFLHLAVYKNKQNVVAKLLSLPNIDVNAKNAQGSTPIMISAFQDKGIFSLLKKHGASLNEVNKQGDTVLHCALFFNDKSLIKELIESGVDPNVGTSLPLTKAVLSRDVEAVKILIEGGAKPFEKGEDGYVPFIQAILRSSPEIVELLLSHPDCKLNIVDGLGNTPAIAALASRDKKKIAFLMKAQAPFPKVLTPNNEIILIQYLKYATTLQDYESIKQLLQWGNPSSDCIALEALCQIKNTPFFEKLDKEGLLPKPPLDEFVHRGFVTPNTLSFFVDKKFVSPAIYENLFQNSETDPKFLKDLIFQGMVNIEFLQRLRSKAPLKFSLLQELVQDGSVNSVYLQDLVIRGIFDVDLLQYFANKGLVHPQHLIPLIFTGMIEPTHSILNAVYRTGNQVVIKAILANNRSCAPAIDIFTIDFFLRSKPPNPQFLRELVKDGLLNIASLSRMLLKGEVSTCFFANLNNRNLLDENFFRELSSGGPILLQFMQKLIEEDLLDPNMEISKCSFFCSLCMGEWRKYTSLIQACINKGGDLHKIGPNGMTPLQMLSKLG